MLLLSFLTASGSWKWYSWDQMLPQWSEGTEKYPEHKHSVEQEYMMTYCGGKRIELPNLKQAESTAVLTIEHTFAFTQSKILHCTIVLAVSPSPTDWLFCSYSCWLQFDRVSCYSTAAGWFYFPHGKNMKLHTVPSPTARKMKSPCALGSRFPP